MRKSEGRKKNLLIFVDQQAQLISSMLNSVEQEAGADCRYVLEEFFLIENILISGLICKQGNLPGCMIDV